MMEAYKLNSKLTEKTGEYVIETSNDLERFRVMTAVYVDGVLTDSVSRTYQPGINEADLLKLVRRAHNSKKDETERLLELYHRVADAGESEPMLQLGIAFYYRGFFKEAEGLLIGVSLLEKDNHKAMSFLGRTFLMKGQIKKAVEFCAAAAALQPTYPDYQYHLGEASLADSQCDQAISAYQRATKENIYYGDAYFSLGLANLLKLLINSDETSPAECNTLVTDNLSKATMIDPLYKTEDTSVGLQLLAESKYRQAFDRLHQVSSVKRRGDRAKLAAQNMKPTIFPELLTISILHERIKYLDKELEQNQSYVDLHNELALCQIHLSRLWWDKGAERFRKAHEINPAVGSSSRMAMEKAEAFYEELAITVRQISEKK